MASRRMLSSDIFEDDFFIGLDLFGRCLWIGIIVKCADDQGRLQDNAILIKSQVFPADDCSQEMIEAKLAHFADSCRILRYTSGSKKVIQILNWWKHQTPQWASKSRYPAPDGWTDREKYHATGGKIENNNWTSSGGFSVSNRVSNRVSNQPTNGLNDGDGEGDVKGEAEQKVAMTATAASPEFASLCTVYEKNIGMITPMVSDNLQADLDTYGLQNCMDAITEALKNNVRKWAYVQSILKRWSVDGRDKPKPGTPPPPRTRKVTDVRGNVIAEVPL